MIHRKSPGNLEKGERMTKKEFAKLIDHTLLRPEATADKIIQLCEEALEFGFGAVCVAPTWVSLASKTLASSSVKVVSVVGFPLGNTLTRVKAYEASQVVKNGADEIDMVINIGALLSGQKEIVFKDIKSVIESAHQEDPKTLIKVILETSILSDDQKILACKLAQKAGADFVKTSTGFMPRGATIQDVSLLRRVVGNRLGVKAAGGIRDLSTAMEMIAAGATRLGCSSSVSIIKEFTDES